MLIALEVGGFCDQLSEVESRVVWEGGREGGGGETDRQTDKRVKQSARCSC